MSTTSYRPETVTREWVIVDLDGQPLGRAASRIAAILRGKHKPTYTPHADCGDFVVVVNASKAKLSGKKATGKIYYRHTGYFGGLKSSTAGQLLAEKPERLVEKVVQGMLPRGPLGRRMGKKLKVYGGADHPHQAQKPTAIDLAKV